MAGNIKGVTIEFQGDTSKLDKSLRAVDKSASAIDKELKQVNKNLKFNPTSVDLWRQKQQLLTQKISETENKLSLLKQKQAAMDASGVDKNSEEYRKLQREIIETESKLKTFKAQLKAVGNIKLRALSEQFKQIGKGLTEAGQQMRGLSMAGAALAGSIGALAYKSGRWADELNTLSKVYSINTTELQKYKAAADLVDVSVEDIAKSHVKLEKSMYKAKDGSGSMAEAFDTLGVSVTNSDGSLRSSDEVFQDVITSLGSMTNETERDAIAQQILGKSAANLNPLIEDMGETYKNVSETLEKYGLDFVDQETLDKANEFNDQLDTIKVLGSTALSIIGSQLAGYLVPALGKVVEWIGKLAEWLSKLDPAVLTTIGVIAAVVAGIAPLLLILGKISFAISSIMGLMSTLGISFAALAGPVGIAIGIIAALIAIGVLLYKNWDTIKAKATAIWNSIKNAVSVVVNQVKQNFNTLKTALTTAWNAIKNTATTVWNGIKNAITKPIQTAKDTVSRIIKSIKGLFPLSVGKIFSNLKIPHIKVSGGKAPFGIGGLGKAPSISVQWYAQGGIFNSPSVIGVGEAGPEAVIPIDKLQNMLYASNRQLLANMGTNEPVVINVYGSDNMSVNELAAAVEARIIQMQKRRSQAWA